MRKFITLLFLVCLPLLCAAQGKIVRKPISASNKSCDYVDLGLSVKWATCNVGALSSSDYGSYLIWDSSSRLPTKGECEELKNKCTWTFSKQNGHNGYYVQGPNGKFIFLPAAGCSYDNVLENVGDCGFYWCSTPSTGHSVYYLWFCDSGPNIGTCDYRGSRFSVRLVSK